MWLGSGGWRSATSTDGIHFTLTQPGVFFSRFGPKAGTDGTGLFVDDDGTGYVVFAANPPGIDSHQHPAWPGHPNAHHDGHIVSIERLTPDLTRTTGVNVSDLFPDDYVESPALFKQGSTYYVTYGSCCCGCQQGSGIVVFSAPSVLGPWSRQRGHADINCRNASAPICGGYGARKGQDTQLVFHAQWWGASRIPLADGTSVLLFNGRRWLSGPNVPVGCHDICGNGGKPALCETGGDRYFLKTDLSVWYPLKFSPDGSILPMQPLDNFTLDLPSPSLAFSTADIASTLSSSPTSGRHASTKVYHTKTTTTTTTTETRNDNAAENVAMSPRPPPSQFCARGPPYPRCDSSDNIYPRQRDFTVTVLERNPYGKPLITNVSGGSSFAYNFNGAWFPAPIGSGATDGLIIRVQEDWRSPSATHPEWTDTGALTAVMASLEHGTVEHIDQGLVFWAGTRAPARVDRHEWGAIDPRIRYRPHTGEYYLTWDNCTFECAYRRSLLSVTRDPFDHTSWDLVGPVIPGMQTAGVALLFRDVEEEEEKEEEQGARDRSNGNEPNRVTGMTNDSHFDNPSSSALGNNKVVAAPTAPRHLAFVSSYDCFTILLAESSDGRNWSITNNTWMQGRPGCWDACGAIAGPQPEALSSGDYLMIYNIDTRIARNETSPLGRCTIGWAILDGKDPSRVIARAEEALVVPELPWETTDCVPTTTSTVGGGGSNNYDGDDGIIPSKNTSKNSSRQYQQQQTCQTPNVIFANGLKPLGNDEFLVLFGGGDSVEGVIKIHVDISAPIGAAKQ